MSRFYRGLINYYKESIIQIESFTPTPAWLSTHVSVNATNDTITTTGTGNTTLRGTKLNYVITPQAGFTTWVYSVGVNFPDYTNVDEDLIDVSGTNSKFIKTAFYNDDGIGMYFTADNTNKFYIKADRGFQFKLNFVIENYFYNELTPPYGLVETYTSPLTAVQTVG